MANSIEAERGATESAAAAFVVPWFRFESGLELSGMRVGALTWGRLNVARDNAVLLCGGASALKGWALPFIGPGAAFDPAVDFLISVDALGGGDSAKPSDGLGPQFPAYGIADIVAAQHAFVTQGLGLQSLKAIAGVSMGSFAALLWALRHPAMVRSLVLWLPGLRTQGTGAVVAERIISRVSRTLNRASLRRAWIENLRYFCSRAFLDGLDEHQRAQLEIRGGADWASWNPEDFVLRYRAVQAFDLLREEDFDALAGRLTCPVLFAPCVSDTLLPFADIQRLAQAIPSSTWAPIQSKAGHLAATQPADIAFLNRSTREFLKALA